MTSLKCTGCGAQNTNEALTNCEYCGKPFTIAKSVGDNSDSSIDYSQISKNFLNQKNLQANPDNLNYLEKTVFYFKKAINQYADFSGKSTRSEYWYFFLATLVLHCAVFIIQAIVDDFFFDDIFNILSVLLRLGLFVPSLALTVRRLHDIDRSAWWVLIGLIPLVGPIILLIWLLQQSASNSRYS